MRRLIAPLAVLALLVSVPLVVWGQGKSSSCSQGGICRLQKLLFPDGTSMVSAAGGSNVANGGGVTGAIAYWTDAGSIAGVSGSFGDGYNRGDAIDANTVVYYKMNGASGAGETDYGTDGVNLTATGSPLALYGPGGLNTGSRQSASGAAFYSTADIGALRGQMAGGAFTVGFWFRKYITDTVTPNQTIWTIAGAASDNTNFPLGLWRYVTTSDQINAFTWVNSSTNTNTVLNYTFIRGPWYHAAWTFTAPSAGSRTLKSYVYCMPVGSTSISAPTQIPDAGEQITVGAGPATASFVAPTGNWFDGELSGFYFKNIAETQAQVCADMLKTRP